jgi:hypothetical protein
MPEYNWGVRKSALIAALSLLAACTKDIQNKDAVRGSIVEYLKAREAKTGLNMDLMEVDVSNLSFSSSGKEAHANVKFTPKAGGGGMQMPYTLDRQGDKWVVRARAEGGENPHGAAGLPALPPNHPPMEKQP